MPHGARARARGPVDLVALATAVLGDPARALEAVAEALRDTGLDPESTHRLVSRVYCHSVQQNPDPRRPGRADGAATRTSPRPGILRALETLSPQQREAIASARFGGLDHRRIADLLHLPAPLVAELIRSGLHEFNRALSHDGSG